jgi:23S rRNA (adenine2503-C2)-methyltransferase
MNHTQEAGTKHPKPSIIGVTTAELVEYAQKAGYPPFHGKQIFRWVHEKLAESFSAMTDLPEQLRRRLDKDFSLQYFKPVQTTRSRDRNTVKHLFLTKQGEGIEVVVLREKEDARTNTRTGTAAPKGGQKTRGAERGDRESRPVKRTAFCISSQIGCPVACLYCATGSYGFVRNLAAGEILNQVLSLMKLHGRPGSILYMGMGEPLLNLKEVRRSMELLLEIGFSHRKITISTCGIIGGMYALADSGLRPRLAVSIGSSMEEKRARIIPATHGGSLAELQKAIAAYRRKTGRRVSLEYTIMEDVNDSKEEARKLAGFAASTGAHVNLIRYNPAAAAGGPPPAPAGKSGAAGRPLSYPASSRINALRKIIEEAGVPVTERYRRGADIGAACGQLIPRDPKT